MSYPPARGDEEFFAAYVCSKRRKVGEKGRKGRGRYEKRWRGYKCRTDETSPVMCGRFRGLRLIAIVRELTVNSVVPDMDNMGELAARSLFALFIPYSLSFSFVSPSFCLC